MKHQSSSLVNPGAEFLSLKEIGMLFSPPISTTSLYKWMRNDTLRLTPFEFGNKKFYRRTDVMTEIARHKALNHEK